MSIVLQLEKRGFFITSLFSRSLVECVLNIFSWSQASVLHCCAFYKCARRENNFTKYIISKTCKIPPKILLSVKLVCIRDFCAEAWWRKSDIEHRQRCCYFSVIKLRKCKMWESKIYNFFKCDIKSQYYKYLLV